MKCLQSLISLRCSAYAEVENKCIDPSWFSGIGKEGVLVMLHKPDCCIEEMYLLLLGDKGVDRFGEFNPSHKVALRHEIFLKDECIVDLNEWRVQASERYSTLVHEHVPFVGLTPVESGPKSTFDEEANLL